MQDIYYEQLNCFGTTVRLYLSRDLVSGSSDSPQMVALQIKTFLKLFEKRLSRFNPASELCQLNESPDKTVPVSKLLANTVAKSLAAAETTNGLITPVVLDYLEQSGYAESRSGVRTVSLEQALAAAPAPRSAKPSAEALWRQVSVNHQELTVTRPPGLRLDLGGVGKGVAVDAAAKQVKTLRRALIDCGGDIRTVQNDPTPEPFSVDVADPFTGLSVAKLELIDGAVATSGISSRIWETTTGFAHHLIDPSTGQPAWTGVVQATALAPTAAEAELLARQVALLGPEAADKVLTPYGGIAIDYAGNRRSIALQG